MKSSKLAWRNVRRNARSYSAYLLSLSFAVMVFFLFTALYYNPQFNNMLGENIRLLLAFRVSAVVVAVFSLTFSWYSAVLFLQNRHKELATYLLLGMSKPRISRILMTETFVIGGIAVFLGIAVGQLFQKLFTMLLIAMMRAEGYVHVEISFRAMVITAAVFFGVSLFTGLYSTIRVLSIRLIHLFQAQKKVEKAPRLHPGTVITGLLGVVLTAGGYGLSVINRTRPDPDSFLQILILTIIGTVLCFVSFVAVLLFLSKERRRKQCDGPALVAGSQVLFRIRKNGAVLAMIAVLNAVSLTAVGSIFSFYSLLETSTVFTMPFSLAFVPDSPEEAENVLQRLHDHKGGDQAELYLMEVLGFAPTSSDDGLALKGRGISFSTFNHVMSSLGRSHSISLQPGEFVLIGEKRFLEEAESSIGHSVPFVLYNENVSEDGGGYAPDIRLRLLDTWEEQPVVPDIVGNYAGDLRVFHDEDFHTMLNLRDSEGLSLADTFLVAGFLVPSGPDLLGLSTYFMSLISEEQNPVSRELQEKEIFGYLGIMLFVGAFIGTVFFLSTGSILFFRQLMEAYRSREEFRILANIGFSFKELKEIILRQSALVFYLPLAVSGLHAFFAINMLAGLMEQNLFLPGAVIFGAYGILYSSYFLVTTRVFQKIVL